MVNFSTADKFEFIFQIKVDGNAVITLTPTEAKRLYFNLSEFFGQMHTLPMPVIPRYLDEPDFNKHKVT